MSREGQQDDTYAADFHVGKPRVRVETSNPQASVVAETLVGKKLSGKAAFYRSLGLAPSPLDPMTLMVTLADLRASTEGTGD